MGINKTKIIMILNIAFLIYSLGGVLGKINSTYFKPLSEPFLILFSIQLLILVVYTVIWQLVIKHIDLNLAYSLKASTIVWGIILAKTVFNETITINNILGAVIIMVGIVMVIRNE